MRLLGFELSRIKKRAAQFLQGINYWSAGPWFGGPIQESFTGAWQRNVIAAPLTTLLSFSAVYACITGISQDISKMRIKLTRNSDGIYEEVTDGSPWLPLLSNPNHFQDSIQFIESWIISKLMYGNAYVLKIRRDSRGLVTDLYVLDPRWVTPLVAPNGDIYYRLRRDDLSQIPEEVNVPASEIIHDRMSTLWHPLVGVSPLYACSASTIVGVTILDNAQNFFGNRSMPGGMLSAPGEISDETAARLKATFESNFGGTNMGKLLVVGDDLKFVPYAFKAQDAQQVEQSDRAVEDVARAFRYPIWKLTGKTPPYTKPDQAQTQYYTDCLQNHIEKFERCMKNGLELPSDLDIELDLEALMRMDTAALFESNNAAKGWMTPDEQRYRANLKPLPKGGDTVYLQHQDYPIEVIADRTDITATSTSLQPAPTPAPARQLEPIREPSQQEIDDMLRKIESYTREHSASVGEKPA